MPNSICTINQTRQHTKTFLAHSIAVSDISRVYRNPQPTGTSNCANKRRVICNWMGPCPRKVCNSAICNDICIQQQGRARPSLSWIKHLQQFTNLLHVNQGYCERQGYECTNKSPELCTYSRCALCVRRLSAICRAAERRNATWGTICGPLLLRSQFPVRPVDFYHASTLTRWHGGWWKRGEVPHCVQVQPSQIDGRVVKILMHNRVV